MRDSNQIQMGRGRQWDEAVQVTVMSWTRGSRDPPLNFGHGLSHQIQNTFESDWPTLWLSEVWILPETNLPSQRFPSVSYMEMVERRCGSGRLVREQSEKGKEQGGILSNTKKSVTLTRAEKKYWPDSHTVAFPLKDEAGDQYFSYCRQIGQKTMMCLSAPGLWFSTPRRFVPTGDIDLLKRYVTSRKRLKHNLFVSIRQEVFRKTAPCLKGEQTIYTRFQQQFTCSIWIQCDLDADWGAEQTEHRERGRSLHWSL